MATTRIKNDSLFAGTFLVAFVIVMDLSLRRDSYPERNPARQLIVLIPVLLYELGTKP